MTCLHTKGQGILVFVLVLLMVSISQQNQCSREVHLAVRSSRNHSGHWNTHIVWRHSAPQYNKMDNRETIPVFLDMSQQVGGCSSVETLSIEAKLTVSPPRAGPGYGLVSGVGWYKFHSTAVTWDVARKVCYDEGGHLGVIRSKVQEDAVKAMFARHPNIEKTNWNDMTWLGFSDQYSEGDFITVLGESFPHIEYANWDAGKPDNKAWEGFLPDSDCGAMRRNGKIIDLPCNANYSFICEQN